MQVTVTLSDGTGTQNIDGAAIVQAIPSNTGSLLQVDQYNGSAVEILVDESPATIATDTGNLLFSVNVVPVPLVVNASFNYDGATTAFQQGERVFIGSSYGEIIALTGSSMTLGNFVGNQLADNDFLRGQQSLCTAQINGAITYTYPQQQATYINVGRCQGLKPAVASLSSLNYIYASPKVEILYTTLTESQLNAANAAAGGGGSGWGLTGNAGTDYTINFIGTTDNEPVNFRTNGVARLGFDELGGALSTTDIFNPLGSYSILQWSDNSIDQKIYVSDVLVTSVGITAGSVTTIIENVDTGIFNQTIVSGAEVLLSASGTGSADIHVYPSGEIGIVASDNLVINASGGGNVGIGTPTPTSKLTVDSGDIEVVGDTNGLILESPDGTRYRVTVANGGTLTVTAV